MVAKSGSKSSAQKSQVGTPVVAGIIVTVLVILSLIGWWMFAPHSEQAPPRALTADEQWIKQKAQESGGDMTRLSPPDQQRLIMLKGDSGPSLLKHYAETK
jgi:hypothetical protein